MNDFIGLAILAIFPICMIFATFYDLFTMTIPNKITLVLLASFAVFAPLAGMGWETALWHIGVAVCVLIVGFGHVLNLSLGFNLFLPTNSPIEVMSWLAVAYIAGTQPARTRSNAVKPRTVMPS